MSVIERIPTSEETQIDFAADVLVGVKKSLTPSINAYGANMIVDNALNDLYERIDDGF